MDFAVHSSNIKEIEEKVVNTNKHGMYFDCRLVSTDSEERARTTVADVVSPDGTPLLVKMG